MRAINRDIIRNIVHEELVDQVISAIEIPLYSYTKGDSKLKVKKTSYGGYFGIDIYYSDKEIYHLHPEDMLYFILTYKTSIEDIKNIIDRTVID